MRVSREISLGSSLHRASTDALISVCVCVLVCVTIQYILQIKSHDWKEFMFKAPDEKTRTDPIDN